MLFRYKKSVEVMDEIELEVPYYYEELSDTDYKMFGAIEGTANGIIEITICSYPKSKEIQIEKYPDPNECNMDYILRYCQQSTKEKFEAAKKEAMEFLV